MKWSDLPYVVETEAGHVLARVREFTDAATLARCVMADVDPLDSDAQALVRDTRQPGGKGVRGALIYAVHTTTEGLTR